VEKNGWMNSCFQFVKHLADEGVGAFPALEPGTQQVRLDVPVAFALDAFALLPIAEVTVAQRLAEQLHHALLGLHFALADGAHGNTSQYPAVREPARLRRFAA
jgi:hypothetical protein